LATPACGVLATIGENRIKAYQFILALAQIVDFFVTKSSNCAYSFFRRHRHFGFPLSCISIEALTVDLKITR
jgi:hypothetical protein